MLDRHAFTALALVGAFAIGASAELREEALDVARKAVKFYSQEVATEGGYLWQYSADLKLREGEGKVGEATVWVQPPGTPAVAEAYVALYEATGDKLFLEAALAAAEALRRGQLRSGGWNASIEFAPQARKAHAYRIDPPGKKTQRNHSSLDDNKTQSALRFLIRLDRATDFKVEAVHETTNFALNGLLKAQLPNGGFPQVWDATIAAADYPPKKAGYPASWPREYPGHQNYWFRYTLNDDLLPDVLAVLLLAADTYHDPKYGAAAKRIGDFLIAAQLPDPQPAWAQQYDFDMHPAWARKFEPPAVTGGESQGALETLLQLYRRTGDERFLEPIPRALAYLKKSRLPDGRLARFYELETNRPLYFTRDYQLTHDDSDMPTHYSFKVGNRLEAIEQQFNTFRKTPFNELPASKKPPRRATAKLTEAVRSVISEVDERGAWVTQGQLKYQPYRGKVLEMRIAVRNLTLLGDYLAATK